MEYYGDQTCSARSAPSTSELVVSRKKRYHTCCRLLCGRGIEVEAPPLRCTLLCGRGIEAQTPPKKKNTDTALCYVCCVLPLTLSLDCVWRVLRVLHVLGAASGTTFGVLMYMFRVMQTHRSSKMSFPTNLYAAAVFLDDCAANIMHGVRPRQTQLSGTPRMRCGTTCWLPSRN